MRKRLGHRWRIGNKSFNDSLTSARAREALNQEIAVEAGKEDKARQRKREGKQPGGGDNSENFDYFSAVSYLHW